MQGPVNSDCDRTSDETCSNTNYISSSTNVNELKIGTFMVSGIKTRVNVPEFTELMSVLFF